MKLAEALILRADCQKRITQLKSRLLVNAKVQEGDAPAETPQELFAELGRVSTELLDLIKRINRTDSATALGGKSFFNRFGTMNRFPGTTVVFSKSSLEIEPEKQCQSEGCARDK